MEKVWKPRREWPEILTIKDMVECVPFLGRPRAQAIMEDMGTKVGGNWAISKAQLIEFLDGDTDWMMGQISKDRFKASQRLLDVYEKMVDDYSRALKRSESEKK